jgi:hypothetical protein
MALNPAYFARHHSSLDTTVFLKVFENPDVINTKLRAHNVLEFLIRLNSLSIPKSS